jgi:endonuclease/exonuclease/phosphatase family metal-dependent hydrolase
MKRMFVLIMMMATAVISLLSADTVRLCTYNVLQFSAANEDGRIPHFATVMKEIQPDILMCQEVVDGALGALFIADVLKHAPFAATPFIDGPDTDCQLLYDQLKFSFVSQRRIRTALRDIAEFTLLTKPSNDLKIDTLVIYSMHLKASDGFEQERSREIDSLLKHMTNARFTVVAGDMNIYAPTEEAYTKLLAQGMVDPLGTTWRRNSAQFAEFYTQCPRKDQQPQCGGGVNGGMDDRFDLILLSSALAQRVVQGTYTHFGNDGVARLNNSIIDPPNQRYRQEVAEAAHCASDHLPVYVDVIVGDVRAGVTEMVGTTLSARIRGSTLVLTGCSPSEPIHLHDITGRVVRTVAVDRSNIEVDVSSLPNGTYVVRQGTASATVSIRR